MKTARYQLGHAPTVTMDRCDGDLIIVGHDNPVVVLTADELPHLAPDQDRATLRIEGCDDDLRLTLPFGATVIADHIDGDLRVAGIARCTLARIDGDLTMEDTPGPCAIGDVDGDVRARAVTNLSIGSVDGDARLEGVTGHFTLGHVTGDLILDGAVQGFGPAHVEGDLTLAIAFQPAHEYRLIVDGDTTIRLPDEANLTLQAAVHGDVSGLPHTHGDGHGRGEVRAAWGDGSSSLSLSVGGDLRIRSGSAGAMAVRRSYAPSVNTMGQEAESTGIVEEQAPAPPVASNPDNLGVLEALAQGKISVDEAESLLH